MVIHLTSIQYFGGYKLRLSDGRGINKDMQTFFCLPHYTATPFLCVLTFLVCLSLFIPSHTSVAY